MAKIKIPSVLEIQSELKSNLIKPIYFLFGEDAFGINLALREIVKKLTPLISSDFDNETFYASSSKLIDIVSISRTYPFGTGKKLIIVKDADEFKFTSKDIYFINYINSPADFTVLVLVYEGKINKIDSEPFKSLLKNNFLYESSELKDAALIKWVINFVSDKNKIISTENAKLLVDIVGENRTLIENQLEKIFEFLGDEKEISFKVIENLTTKLKTYTIFNLFDAIDKNNSKDALKIAYNLLDFSDLGLLGIVAMLNKHFTTLLRIEELEKLNLSKEQKAKITGTHSFYYSGLVMAARLYGYKNIVKALNAIYNADVLIKSTSIDEKTILSMLITEIIPDE